MSYFPERVPSREALYKAYVDVTGDTANEPMVIGGRDSHKVLKNIIAFGPEKLGIVIAFMVRTSISLALRHGGSSAGIHGSN